MRIRTLLAGAAALIALCAGAAIGQAAVTTDNYVCTVVAEGTVDDPFGNGIVIGYDSTSATVACAMVDANGITDELNVTNTGDGEQSSGAMASAATVGGTTIPLLLDIVPVCNSILGAQTLGSISWNSEAGIPPGAGEHETISYFAALAEGVGPMVLGGGLVGADEGAGAMSFHCLDEDSFTATFTFAWSN